MTKNNNKKIKERKYYRQKTEVLLLVASVIFSLAIYLLLSYLGYKAVTDKREQMFLASFFEGDMDIVDFILTTGGYISIIILVIIIFDMIFEFLKTHNRAFAIDIHVSEKQFPELLEYEKEYAKKLGIKSLPYIYVSSEEEMLNTYSFYFDDKNIVRVSSVDAFISKPMGNFTGKFAVAKKLANIYMGYCNYFLFVLTIFSNWIPIFKHLRNRVTNYTSDKIAAELIGKENAMKAIMMFEVNQYALPHINIEEYMKNAKMVASAKEMVFANVLRDMPIPAYRIEAIMDERDGRLF